MFSLFDQLNILPRVTSHWKGTLKNCAIFAGILLLCTLLLVYFILAFRTHYYISDFRAFYTAAQIFRLDPEQTYSEETQIQFQDKLAVPIEKLQYEYLPFINPPFLLLLYLPTTFFPPSLAHKVLLLILFLLMSTSIASLFFIFGIKKHKLVLFLVALTFAPVFMNLLFIQNAPLALGIFTGVYYLLRRKQYFSAGLLASFLLYKMQLTPVLFGYLFLTGNKRIIQGLLLGIGILALLSIFLLREGTSEFLELNFWYIFIHDSRAVHPIFSINIQTIFHSVESIFSGFPVRPAALTVGGLALLATWKRIEKINPTSPFFTAAYCLIIVTTIFFGPHIQLHDVLLLLFPFLYFWSRGTEKIKLFLLSGWLLIFLASFQHRLLTTSLAANLYLAISYGLLLCTTGIKIKNNNKLVSNSFSRSAS